MLARDPKSQRLYRFFINEEIRERIKNELGHASRDSLNKLVHVLFFSVLEDGKWRRIEDIDVVEISVRKSILDRVCRLLTPHPEKIAHANGHPYVPERLRLLKQKRREENAKFLEENMYIRSSPNRFSSPPRLPLLGFVPDPPLELSPIAEMIGFWDADDVLLQVLLMMQGGEVKSLSYKFIIELFVALLREKDEVLPNTEIELDLPKHPPPIYLRPQLQPNAPALA
jgi:hypothetical protein